MASGPHAPLIGFLRRLAAPDLPVPADGELLHRFVQQRDEAAFATLVQRHGPLVLAACRRLLRSAADVEDAFQAVFLVLARRAGAVARPEQLGPWLYGVAVRVARKARDRAARSRPLEAPESLPARPDDPEGRRELEAVLDEELGRLPEKYRTPLVLCCLQGLSREEAAARLGRSPGALKGLLERGRERLRQGLERRGVPAASLPPVLAGTVLPMRLADAAVAVAARSTAGLAVDAAVASLTQGVIPAMHLLRWKTWFALALVLLACGGVGLATQRDGPPPPVVSPANRAAEAETEPKPEPKKAADELDLKTSAAALAFTRDGKRLIVAGGDGVIRLWDPDAGKIDLLKQHKKAVSCLALTRDGQTLASAGEDGQVILWDVPTRKILATIATAAPAGLAFSPDDQTLAGAARGDVIVLWEARRQGNAPTGKALRQIRCGGMKESLCSLAFSPDGKQILAGAEVALNSGANWTNFRLLDAQTGKELVRHESPRRGADALKESAQHRAPVAFSPDGRTWAGGSSDAQIALPKGNSLRTDHKGITAVLFSKDGKTLFSAGREGSVRFTDVADAKELAGLKKQGVVLALARSPDGKRLAWANAAGKVKVADVARLVKANAVKEKK